MVPEKTAGSGAMRTALRICIHGLLWSVISVAALVLSLLFHLDSAGGRHIVAEAAADIVSDLLVGDLSIEGIDELTVGRIEIHGVALRGSDGVAVASLESAVVDFDAGALLSGEIHVPRVVVTGPVATLAPTAAGDDLALVAAVMLRDPSPASEEGGGSVPVIRIDQIVVTDLGVAELGGGYTVHSGNLVGRLDLDGTVKVTIAEMSAEVRDGGQPLARLETLSGRFDMEPGSLSAATFSVAAGDDRVTGEASLQWTDDGPGEGRVDLDLDISPALLDHLGVAGGSALVHSGVTGTISVHGSLEEAAVAGSLDTDGGPVRFGGAMTPSSFEAEVAAADLSLGDIIPLLGDTRAGGVIRARMDRTQVGDQSIALEAERVRYGEWVLPEVDTEVVVGADRVTIGALSIPHLGEDFDVAGYVTFDGDAELAVRARIPNVAVDENLARLAPGVRGRLDADLNLRVVGGEVLNLDVDGRVSTDDFRAPGLRAGHLDIRGSARGDAAHPVVDVRVNARGLRAGDVVVEQANFELRGGPTRYAAAGTVNLGGDDRVSLDATILYRGGRYLGDAELELHGLWPEPVRVVLRRAVFDPGRFVSAERLSAESTGLSLIADGRYAFVGASDLRATIDAIDLARLGQALGRPLASGIATGAVTFAGSIDRPEVTLRGDARDLAMGPLEFPEIAVEAALSSERREVSGTVHADAAGYGQVDFEGAGNLADARRIEDRLSGGNYEFDLTLEELPANLLALASPDLPPFDGSMDVQVTARGTADAPQIDLGLELDDFSADGIAPMEASARVTYANGTATATVGVDDATGPLATAYGEVAIDLPAVARGATFDVAGADAVLDISVPLRRLDRLPQPFTIDIPARASLEAQLRRTGGATTGNVEGRVSRYAPAVSTDGCSTGPMLAVRYRATLDDGQTVLEVDGDAGGRALATLRAEAATPVDEWLIDGLPSAPPAVSIRSRAERLDLAHVPVVCAQASGLATLRIDADDLLTATPHIDIEGAVETLSFGPGSPVELRFAGGVDDGHANIDAMIHHEDRNILELVVDAAVAFGDDGLSPAIADGPAHGRLRLDRAPARVILGPAPNLAQISGALDGEVTVELRGEGGGIRLADDFHASGEITLDEMAFILTDPVVRVDGLNGALAFSDEGIELREIRMRDRGGTLAVDGRVGMEGLTPRTVAATVVADDWNLRADGVVFASVSAEVDIAAELGDEEREIRATFDDLSIEVPEELGHSVQSLEQHPEVIYEDQPGFYVGTAPPGLAASSAQNEPTDRTELVVPTRVIIDATDPFWIRRNDFSVHLTADLRVDSDAAGTRMTGVVEVKRGFINLVGRAFDLNDGEIIFTGGSQVDPTLDLTAVHMLKSRETVTVTITGRLSDPRINFSTTVPDVHTEAEIIDLLVSGHGGTSMDARDQMVSVVGAMTAGFISSMTRRSAGSYIPVMSIEAGGGGSTRIRAGVSADGIIPDFLDGIVESAYVEGFVGSSQELTDASGGTSSTGTQGGFVIELYWPKHIVTTGSYEQPANWSLDVTWEP